MYIARSRAGGAGDGGMRMDDPRQAGRSDRNQRLGVRLLAMAALGIGIGCSDAPQPPLGGPSEDCAEQRAAFAATLPVPSPTPGRYVVQLVNESTVTLLAGADAAHVAGSPPRPVLPRENTWILGPKSVLTIDIPEEWEGTSPPGS